MTFRTRQFQATDYEILAGFWRARAAEPPHRSMLPTRGLVVEDENSTVIGGLFIYLADDKSICFLSWICSNPNYDILKRREALAFLIKEAVQFSRWLGARLILGATSHPALWKPFTEAGMSEGDDGVTHFFIKGI